MIVKRAEELEKIAKRHGKKGAVDLDIKYLAMMCRQEILSLGIKIEERFGLK